MLLAGVVQVLDGAREIGVSTDEPTHVLRTQGWLDHGWYVPSVFLVNGAPSGSPRTSPDVYGPAFAGTAHALNTLAGNESWDSVSATSDAYTVRHLAAALLAIAAALAGGLAVRTLTGSRQFGIWTTAAMFAIPIWTGMGMFNPKDTPAAAGYTLFTVGLVLALGQPQSSRTSPGRGSAVAALLASGYFFAAGTRLALWLPLAISLLVYAVITVARVRFGKAERDPVQYLSVVMGCVAGLAAVVAIYPAVFSSPLDFLTGSVTSSADYPWSGFTLTAGRLLGPHPPWWYLPAWIFASTPLLILSLSVFGGLTWIGSMLRRASGGAKRFFLASLRRGNIEILLILLQVLLLPLGSVVLGSTMYTGLRQHLYMVPALAMLAGYGAWRLWNLYGRNSDAGRWRKATAGGLICAALVFPMAEQSLLFPFNYTYVSPLAGVQGVNGRWETDYWWASSRAALKRIPAKQKVHCTSQASPELSPSGSVGRGNCGLALQLSPYLGVQGQDARTYQEDAGKVWAIGRSQTGGEPPDHCRSVDNVTRWLRGEQVVMSWVLRCDRAALNH